MPKSYAKQVVHRQSENDDKVLIAYIVLTVAVAAVLIAHHFHFQLHDLPFLFKSL